MDTQEQEPRIRLSRRSFIAAMGVSGAALAVAACAAPAATTEAPSAPAEEEAPTAAPEEEAAPTAAPSAEGVTITVSSWFNKGFVENMPAFNEKYPDITVEVIDEEFAAHHDKLLTALVAGTGATDVTGIEDSRVYMMADTGGLADLTDYMAPYKDQIVSYKLNLAPTRARTWPSRGMVRRACSTIGAISAKNTESTRRRSSPTTTSTTPA
jgi:ABC-type glycerol-3-phosphate transport system substrate-binding protein